MYIKKSHYSNCCTFEIASLVHVVGHYLRKYSNKAIYDFDSSPLYAAPDQMPIPLNKLLFSFSLHAVETTHMYIPNSAVGAVIGAKGSYIRDLNKYSGFSIKIASATDETSSYPAAVNASDRRVTIVGPSDRFWAVSFYIIFFFSLFVIV